MRITAGRFSRMAAGLVLVAAVSGCGAKVIPNEVFGSTPGVVIQGDGFEVAEGNPIPLPFVLDPAPVDDKVNIVEGYEAFRKKGAAEVRVTVPGRSEPLYGLFSLHALPGDATGPARRSLSVKVPESYVNAATDGRISVVYEPVRAGDEQFYGWVLWMSDRPF